jgi:hypothetical protein
MEKTRTAPPENVPVAVWNKLVARADQTLQAAEKAHVLRALPTYEKLMDQYAIWIKGLRRLNSVYVVFTGIEADRKAEKLNMILSVWYGTKKAQTKEFFVLWDRWGRLCRQADILIGDGL